MSSQEIPGSLMPLKRRIQAFEQRLRGEDAVLLWAGDGYAVLDQVIYDSGLVTFVCNSSSGPTEIVQCINHLSITIRSAPPPRHEPKKPVTFKSVG